MLTGLADVIRALAALTWPAILATALFFLYDPIKNVIQDRGLTVKIGDLEVSISDVVKEQNSLVEDVWNDLEELRTRVSALEPRSANGGPISTGGISRLPEGENIGTKVTSVLWVDDHPQNNAILVEKMRRTGVRVDIALSTREAEVAAATGRYSVVITDMGRTEPGSTIKNITAGLDLIKSLRQSNIPTPIVVFSSRSRIVETDAYGAGAQYVTNSWTELMRYLEIGAEG